MKKQSLILCLLLIAVGVCSVAFAGHTFLDWPSNGNYTSGVGPAKIVAVDAIGSALTNGTVILSRIPSDNSSTNAFSFGTLTCSSGAVQQAITNTVWVFTDDTIQRTGTATNARVRVVLEK